MDSEKQKILIADDEEINLQLLTNIFADEHELILVKSGREVIEKAKESDPDLILLDVKMPDIDGYEVIKLLKEDDKIKEIPVIFVSALSKISDEEKGLLLGAVDYISKPFSAAIVKARVKTHLKMVKQKKLLEKIAMLDGLTEIPNRRSFNERFELEWRRAVRNKTSLSLGIVDIDYFKQYNDNYGHSKGDEALKAVSGVLQKQLKRPPDFAARIGGEEFAVLIPETNMDGAKNVVERIRRTILELEIEHAYSKVCKYLSVSIGGATIIPDRQDNIRDLFEKADKMLYLAKETGRNKSEWYRENHEAEYGGLFSRFKGKISEMLYKKNEV